MATVEHVTSIIVDDGRLKLRILINLYPPEKKENEELLTSEQTTIIKKELVRRFSQVLSGISYTDFGIENIKIMDIDYPEKAPLRTYWTDLDPHIW